MLIVFSILSCVITIAYILYVHDIKQFSYKRELQETVLDSHPFVSVIICARNEAKYIKPCLESINALDYPMDRFEVILIDDHSTDKTVSMAEIVGMQNLRIISLADHVPKDYPINSYKKLGITQAIKVSNGNMLAFTDADCIVPKHWLKRIVSYLQYEDIKFVASPVFFKPVESFLQWFQQFDFLAMMRVTEAGINSGDWFLANGANMACVKSGLPRKLYQESNKTASGDDVFLINEVAKQHGRKKIVFDQHNIVYSAPVTTLRSFISQRIRWAGKNKRLARGKTKNVLLIPVLMNLLLIALGFFSFVDWWLLIALFVCFMAKVFVDWSLIKSDLKAIHGKGQNYFGKFFLASLWFPLYLVGIGFLSLFKTNYSWKGRTVS